MRQPLFHMRTARRRNAEQKLRGALLSGSRGGGLKWGRCILIKLVLLEWSESKSDGKFGFSMLKNLPVQIFGVIGATSDVCQHIVIFA